MESDGSLVLATLIVLTALAFALGVAVGLIAGQATHDWTERAALDRLLDYVEGRGRCAASEMLRARLKRDPAVPVEKARGNSTGASPPNARRTTSWRCTRATANCWRGGRNDRPGTSAGDAQTGARLP